MAHLAIAAAVTAGASSAGVSGIWLSVVWGVSSALAQYALQPDLPARSGPQIQDNSISTASEGMDMPIVWGTVRLAGNRIWSDSRITHTHTEEYGGKGGPTGEHTTYTYSRSFAVSFGRFESTHVSRVWANRKLIYDARSGANTVATAGLNFTLHTGSLTQTADSTIEASVGSGNAPGYRGQSYLVFRDLPLTDYSGQTPSIEVEITTSGSDTPSSVYEELATSSFPPTCIVYDPDRDLFWMGFGDPSDSAVVVAVDPYSKSVVRTIALGVSNAPNELTFVEGNLAVRIGTGATTKLTIYNPDTLAVVYTTSPAGVNPVECNGYLFLNDGTNCALYRQSAIWFSPTYVTGVPAGWNISGAVSIAGESKYLVGLTRASDSELGWAEFTPFIHDGGGDNWTVAVAHDAALSGYSFTGDVVHDTVNDLYWWMMGVAGGINLLATDKEGSQEYFYNVVTEVPDDFSYNVSGVLTPRLYFDDQSSAIWMNLDRTDANPPKAKIIKLDIVNHEFRSWPHSISNISAGGYHTQTDTFVTGNDSVSSSGVSLIRVNSISSTAYSVADIIGELCGMAGLSASDINTSTVTDTLIGYKHSRRVPARMDIEPLLQLYFLDAVQSDYKLKFIPRGGASVATFTTEDLAAHEEGGDTPPAIEHMIPQSIDIPKSLDIQYLSEDSGQQPAVARAQWVTGSSERSASLIATVVFPDQEVMEITDKLLMQAHDVEMFTFALSRKWSKLDPGDVVTIPVDDKTYDVLLSSVGRGANGLNNISAVLYGASNQTTYTEAGGTIVDVEVPGNGPANPIVIDSGLLRDVDQDHPGPYIAAYNYTSGFPAVGVYRSTDGSDFQLVGALVNEPALGRCETVPSAVDFEDWDTTNTLTVDFINGTPSTITDAQVLGGGNAVAWGQPGRWEILQFANQSLVSGTEYTVSRLLRGRRGTDWAMTLHEAADLFILIDGSSMMRVVMAVADIGADRWFKLPSASQPVIDAITKYWEVGNNPLMPYSASDPSAAYASGTGWEVDWTRRTRRGGLLAGPNSVTDGVEGSIGEDSEEYEVDIFLQSDTATIIRAYSALATPEATYTDANMTTDGVTPWEDIGFNIYQISAVVDRGYVRQVLADGAGDNIAVLNPGAETAGAGSLPANWVQDSSSGGVIFRRWASATGSGWSFDIYYGGPAPSGGYAIGICDHIDLTSDYTTGELDTGTMQCFMSSDVAVTVAAAVGDNEFVLGFRYYDATPTLLSSDVMSWTATTGFVTSVWQNETYASTIPTGTRQIRIVVGSKRGAGYAYVKTIFDNVILKCLV